MKSALVSSALLVLCGAVWAPSFAASTIEENRDGVVRVELEELWRVGDDEDSDVLFGVIYQVVHDANGNLFVLDGQLSQIHVFAPSGELLRTIGREGEGPGEFRTATDMYLGPDGILGAVQIFPGKVVQLTTDGDPAGSFPLPEIPGGGFQLVYRVRANADRLVLAGGVTRTENGERMQVRYLKAFDVHGAELANYHQASNPSRYGEMHFQEQHWTGFHKRWSLAMDGRVACALDFDAYRIHVWNQDGRLERVIERPDYEPLARSHEEKKRYQKMYDALTRWNPGSTFTIRETHQSLPYMSFREDGSLWVLPSSGVWGNDTNLFASLDVYDPNGHYVQRIELVAPHDAAEDGLFFVGDRVYVVTDFLSSFMANLEGDASGAAAEDVEPTSLIAYRLRPATVGLK